MEGLEDREVGRLEAWDRGALPRFALLFSSPTANSPQYPLQSEERSVHPAIHLPESIQIVRAIHGGLHQRDAGSEQAPG
jgi:hypothetical protein